MAGAYPVDLVKKSVENVALIMNVVSKVVNKAGIFVLLEAISPVKELAAINMAELKNQIADMDDAEGVEVKAAFLAKLQLHNAMTQDKFAQAADCVAQGVDMVSEGIELYQRVVGLIAKVKSIFAPVVPV